MKLNWKAAALGIGAAAAIVLTGGAVIGATIGVVGTAVGIIGAVVGAATTIATAATLLGTGALVAKAVLSPSEPQQKHAVSDNTHKPSSLAKRRDLGQNHFNRAAPYPDRTDANRPSSPGIARAKQKGLDR